MKARFIGSDETALFDDGVDRAFHSPQNEISFDRRSCRKRRITATTSVRAASRSWRATKGL